MKKIVFGAYDPLYPNGLMSIAGEENLFGIRLVTKSIAGGKIYEGRKSLDFTSLRIGPVYGDRFYRVEWSCEGKKASFSFGRIDEKNVWGHAEAEEGLKLLFELYVPRAYRLKYEWANFTKQADRMFAGEMITPFRQCENRAVRLLFSEKPLQDIGFIDREKQLADYEETGTLRNLAPGDIWNDCGLSWQYAAEFSGAVDFLYTVGEPEEFLRIPTDQETDILIGKAGSIVRENRENGEKDMMRGQGALAGIPEAMCAPIFFNTMYREDTGHRFVMVDRTWARSDDDWGMTFNWDTFLSSLTLNWFDAALAKENILGAFDTQLPDGRIPLLTQKLGTHRAEPPITAGRGQHIVQGYTVWQTYLRTLDRTWLSECFEKLKKAHAWWFKDRGDGQAFRDGNGEGLLGFGYDPVQEMGVLGARVQPYVGKAQYAYFETYDDSPQWTDGIFFKTVKGMKDVTEADVTDIAKYTDRTHTADLYTLERCCLYAVDAECLSKMARVLGKTEDAALYEKQYEEMKARVNELMWDEEDGCYYNRRFDGSLSKVRTPDCFMPLMAGFASEERTERLMKILLRDNDFWGPYKMPSVARSDPAYPDQRYWRGQIWPPQVLWTYLGLRRAGKYREAWALAESSAAMLRREWEENGYYPENYNGDTGRCSGAEHYNWGTLMGEIALSEMAELTEDSIIFGRSAAPDGTGLRGIRLDGHFYDVYKENGFVKVYRDGKLLTEAESMAVIRRDV